MLIELGIICGLIVFSLPVLSVAGVFQREKIVGPSRMLPGESLFTPLTILLLSFVVAVLGAKVISLKLRLSPDQLMDVINGILYAIFLVVALTLITQMRPRGLKQVGLTAKKFFLGIPQWMLAVVTILPLVYAASFVVQMVLVLLNHKPPQPHPMLPQLQTDRHSIWFGIVIFEAVALVPLAEELLFRGLLQTIFVYLFAGRQDPSAKARWLGILVTAALFAAAHGEPAFFLPLFVLAIGLGYLYERTGNLWACAFLHGSFNAIQICLYLMVAAK